MTIDESNYDLSETANYKEQKVREYKGNPLIEALPAIIEDDDEVIEALYSLPFFTTEEKLFSPRLKSHVLRRIKTFLQPFPVHVRLENMVSVLIRDGYKSRNPFNAQYKRKLQILNKLRNTDCNIEDVDAAYSGISTTADCAIITGYSGLGKTTAINQMLSHYPQVIRHESYGKKPLIKTQIVWLKVDCPTDGDFVTLCRSIFGEIDRLTGERWLDKYGYLSRSRSTMVMHLVTLLNNYNVGLLVLDEIQYLGKKKDEEGGMLDFFVTLTNVFSMPIIFIGTPDAKKLFTQKFRLARRIQSGGSISLEPLKEDSEEWNVFLESLWDLNLLEEDTNLDEKIRKAFYKQCQGIIGIAVLLFICSQSRAMLSDEKKLTPQRIEKVAHTDLEFTQPMITALRSGNPKRIAKFSDMRIDEDKVWKKVEEQLDFEERMMGALLAKKDEIKEKRQNSYDALYISICSSDLFSSLDKDEIRYIIDAVTKTCDVNTTEAELKIIATERLIDANKKKMAKKKADITLVSKDDSLLSFYDEAIRKQEHPKDRLKKKGYIKNPFEEFMKVT